MNEEQAHAVADALGGETWQSGGETWLVLIPGIDGRTVVIGENSVCEYDGDPAAGDAKQLVAINFERRPITYTDKYGRLYILGLPVEPDMMTLRELIGDEDGD